MDNKEKLIRFNLDRFLDETKDEFQKAVSNYPIDRINENPPNVIYSVWQLLDHIRFTQKDIADFIIDPDYKEPKWPDDYWPDKETKANEKMWNNSRDEFIKDLEKLTKITNDENRDLYGNIPWGDGQILFEEIIKANNHSLYHIGELGVLRQVMKTW